MLYMYFFRRVRRFLSIDVCVYTCLVIPISSDESFHELCARFIEDVVQYFRGDGEIAGGSNMNVWACCLD